MCPSDSTEKDKQESEFPRNALPFGYLGPEGELVLTK